MSTARVLYDGDCPFCRKSIELVKKLDWLGKLQYVNVRHLADPLLQHALVAGAPLLEQMHVFPADEKRLYGGYRAVRWISWRVPLTWPIAPFLYLPGMTWLGQKAYMWVARNRFKIVPCDHGVCNVPPRHGPRSPADPVRDTTSTN